MIAYLGYDAKSVGILGIASGGEACKPWNDFKFTITVIQPTTPGSATAAGQGSVSKFKL